MTEDEAKKKWCPMTRITMMPHVDDSFSLASNRDISLLVPPNSFDPATDITKCLASDCMMWQEDPTRGEVENGFYPLEGHCGLSR